MNPQGIFASVALRTGYDSEIVKRVAAALSAEIAETLARGSDVSLGEPLGVLVVKSRDGKPAQADSPRSDRNPYGVVVFKASKTLKKNLSMQ